MARHARVTSLLSGALAGAVLAAGVLLSGAGGADAATPTSTLAPASTAPIGTEYSPAVATASAAPRVDQRLGILGEVSACGAGRVPLRIDYRGNTGDHGRANLYYGYRVRYDAQLRHVGHRGQAIVFTIRCSGTPKSRSVTRTVPGPGNNGVVSINL